MKAYSEGAWRQSPVLSGWDAPMTCDSRPQSAAAVRCNAGQASLVCSSVKRTLMVFAKSDIMAVVPGRILTAPRISPSSRDAEAGSAGEFSPGGRFENSPAVHYRVHIRQSTSPGGTAESAECHATVPIPILVSVIQPSLRDSMRPCNSLSSPSGRQQTNCLCCLSKGRRKMAKLRSPSSVGGENSPREFAH